MDVFLYFYIGETGKLTCNGDLCHCFHQNNTHSLLQLEKTAADDTVLFGLGV